MDKTWRHANHDWTTTQLTWAKDRGVSFFTDMDSRGTEGFTGPGGSARVDHVNGGYRVSRRVGRDGYHQLTGLTIREAVIFCTAAKKA